MNIIDFLTPQVILLLSIVLCFCIIFLIIGCKIGLYFGKKKEALEWESGKLESIVKTRLKQSRAVIGGLVSEQIAPLLPDFPFDPGDCRFIGKPIDFIIFKGMNEQNITEVIFLEVKTGTARNLNEPEKQLKKVIENRNVRWMQYSI